MIDPASLLIIPISFLAFLLKSVATFGPGVIMVPLGALLIGAREIVIVIGILDLISNASLLKHAALRSHNRTWIPMALAMTTGSFAGAALLVFVPARYFDLLLGAMLLPLGIWFLARSRREETIFLRNELQEKASGSDIGIAAAAGCMGGLAGITGPVLAAHLGRIYQKEAFRQIMIPVLFVSALVRTATYAGAGLITTSVMTLVLLAVPGLFIGLWLGGRLFQLMPQQWFSRVVGVLITLSGIKLLAR